MGGDRWGCPDTDGDGWSDLGDFFIHEPTQWRDTDGDGFGDDANETKAMPVLKFEGHQSLTAWDVEIPMAMAGQTLQTVGLPPLRFSRLIPNRIASMA